MSNTSEFKPVGHAVLLAPYELEAKKGVIQLPDDVKRRMQMLEHRAVVVEIGSEAWMEEARPRAKVGDKVMVTQHAGHMCTSEKDGKTYRLVNDRDVFCVVE